MISLSESDNGGSVRIRLGEPVTIRLTESASGGYIWAPDRLDTDILELVSIERRADAGAIGSAVDAVVNLTGRRPGKTELMLKHWRPWEGDASITERFRIRIEILS